MDYLLTLVASCTDAPLTAAHAGTAARLLQGAGEPEWLAPGKALDLALDRKPEYAVLETLRSALDDAQIDVFCTPAKGRVKKLVLADMDSTIVKGETLDDLADEVGLKDRISAITARAMNGELDFHAALHERVALLEGLGVDALERTLEALELNPGAELFIRTMRAHGAQCVLVSGGFTFFTEAVAERTGFQTHHGNRLEIADGRLTGRVLPPVLDKDAKVAFLEQYRTAQGLSFEDCLSIGDGANDLPMLEKAGLGIGYMPKPALAERLDNQIRHGDLSAALYAQGLVPA